MSTEISPIDRRLACWPDLDRLPAHRALWSGDSAPCAAPHDPLHDPLHGALRAALSTALTPKQRQAVELYYFEGRTEQEIAERLGVSQQVVHRRIHGARRGGRIVGGALARLRKALAPWSP